MRTTSSMSSAMPSFTPRNRASANGHTLYEKNDSVLWAFTPGGIVLHNFETASYLELEGDEYVAWSYFDGVHTLDEIAGKLSTGRARNIRTAMTKVTSTFEKLHKGGFVVRRAP